MALTNVDLYRIDGTIGSVSNISTASLNGGPLAGTRNRIINGDMRIDQRNAGASSTPSAYTYTVDRWALAMSQGSKLTVGQNLNSVTTPAAFTNYLGVSTASAVSIAAGDFFFIRQYIEGFNFADLAWGTASASAVTLSFVVRSSLTGTFGGVITNSAGDRSYPFTYSIGSANTWTNISVTITGDTTGTWLTNNGIGCAVVFSLGSGSTYSGTAGAWSASNLYSATGATSVVGTNGATFYLTGVQLEAGTVATPFERRSYGQELALCQRYFEAISSNGNLNGPLAVGSATSGTRAFVHANFQTPKRAAPTLTFTAANTYLLTSANNTGLTVSAVSADTLNHIVVAVIFDVASGLVAGSATRLVSNGTTIAAIYASSEL